MRLKKKLVFALRPIMSLPLTQPSPRVLFKHGPEMKKDPEGSFFIQTTNRLN
jgi:hypothetical protein